MSVYQNFAPLYARGPYPNYSRSAVDVLPSLFLHLDIPSPGRLLDVACGEGSFAIAMAQAGWQVSGLDQSPEMIAIASEKARNSELKIEFCHHDMRQPYPFEGFDLVTCWYDSLNYLLSVHDLLAAFTNVRAALKPGGWFLFDMNTIYGLAVGWQRNKAYIQQDTDSTFEAHRTSYDYDEGIASVRITGFIRRGDLWERLDETHQERGYSLDAIRGLLAQADFAPVEIYGNLRDRSAPHTDSPRVWVVARAS